MRTLATPLFLFSSLVAWGQARNANWVFSDGMWMHFADSTMAMLPSPYSSSSRSACISDTSGQFLLLADDSGIRDAQFNLLAGASAAELGWNAPNGNYLILPMPGAQQRYLVLVNEMPPDARAGFVEVDLAENGGAGAVVAPGTTWYMQHTTAKLTATTDAAGEGYWIAQHADSGDALLAFHLSNAGLDPVPVTSHAGRPYVAETSNPINADLQRPMKFSSTGHLLGAITMRNDLDSNAIELFHFNRETGSFSHLAQLTTQRNLLDMAGQVQVDSTVRVRYLYDFDFSPDDLHLYYCSWDTVTPGVETFFCQMELFPLMEADIQQSAFSMLTMGVEAMPGPDQLGSRLLMAPDGSLYYRELTGPWPWGVEILQVYALPSSMGIFSGPDRVPLYDFFALPSAPYANFVGSLPNVCKRYVDSTPLVTGLRAQVEEATALRVWPNPAVGPINLHVSGDAMPTLVKWRDLLGNNLGETPVLGHGTIIPVPRQGLPPGVYMLEIMAGTRSLGFARVLCL